MRYSTFVALLAVLFLVPLAPAAEAPSGKAAVAEKKAEVLEEKAATNQSVGPAAEKTTITKTEAQAVDPAGAAALDDAITCLARTIYWEAKGEGSPDMEGVANVVLNRVGHDGFPDTVCGVVKQGVESKTCQFSWWCDGKPDEVQEENRYAVAKEIARKALNQQLPDRTNGALYFHDRTVKPDWSTKYAQTTQTKRFTFYKPRDGKAM